MIVTAEAAAVTASSAAPPAQPRWPAPSAMSTQNRSGLAMWMPRISSSRPAPVTIQASPTRAIAVSQTVSANRGLAPVEVSRASIGGPSQVSAAP